MEDLIVIGAGIVGLATAREALRRKPAAFCVLDAYAGAGAYSLASPAASTGEWRDALRHYRFTVSHPGDPLAKWGPWAQYYIGEVHEAQGDEAAARTAYERALANDEPFAYHKALEQRAKAALGRL